EVGDPVGVGVRFVERGTVQKNRGDVAVPSGKPAEYILGRNAALVIVGHQEIGNRPNDVDPFFVWDPLVLFSSDDRHRSGKIGHRTLRLGDDDVAEIDLSFPGRSPFGRFGRGGKGRGLFGESRSVQYKDSDPYDSRRDLILYHKLSSSLCNKLMNDSS